MNTDPTISVIMPTYNEEGYIAEAIESILSQTFEDFEYLIIDDGSTDRTVSIIESYAEDDERIRIFTNDSNQGLPISLNKGIAEARGEYIARMDADDRSLPERFATQIQFLNTNTHIHLVGCHVQFIDSNGYELSTLNYSESGKKPEARKQSGTDVAHPSVMMRRASVEAVGNYREPFTKAQDIDLWVRMAREFGPNFAVVIPQVLFEYRLTPDYYRRQKISNVYASYAGDFVGEEDELCDRIAARLKQEDTILQPARQLSMYHFRVGQMLHGMGDEIPSLISFMKAAWNDPVYTTRNGLYHLRNRLSR